MLFRFWSLSQALLSTFPSVFLLMQRHSHCLYQLQMEGFLSRGFHLWLYDRIQRRRWHPTPVLLPGKPHGRRSLVGCSPRGHKESDTTERLHFHFYALEKKMATHSSVLAWRIPGMGEPGGLPSMGSHRVGHDWSDLASAATAETCTFINIAFFHFI